MIRVLLVEDDRDLAAGVLDYLELENMVTDHAANGIAGLNLIRSQRYDVIVLDLNLPKLDGLKVCEHARGEGHDTPILMLTARDTLEDKVVGFAQGADDYLVKPFAIEELVMRIRALANRRSGQVTRRAVGDLELDIRNREVTRLGQAVRVSPTTFRLFERLSRACPEAVSREDLMFAIWGEDQPDSNSLKVHVHHLRRQLAEAGSSVKVETVTGLGFRLNPDGEAE
ncbi:MAG: DNA-binding response regulator [Gammaproteobacteria bacterium]|nr:MAG: DNA-binding response regulator [Gammaproteobacteria bacterium]